jgi:hypothetical protein
MKAIGDLLEIAAEEEFINVLRCKLLVLKHDYLKSKGWDISKIGSFPLTYSYEKDGHMSLCEDHALEHQIDLNGN